MNQITHRIAITLAAALMAGCVGTGVGVGDLVGGTGGDLLNAGHHALKSESLSEKDEDGLGESVAVALTNQWNLVDDAKLQQYVNLVGLTVATASDRPSGHYVFGVLDTPEVNAFSGPNGYIFITRGALDRMSNEAQLAGVLAHEVAHVAAHHGLKQVQAAERQGAITSLAQAADSTGQLNAFSDAGVNIITKQGYSQPQEFDADKTGVKIMADAGYDPAAFLQFLQQLQQAETGSSGKLMSTHPGVADRIRRVSDQLKTLPPGGVTLQDRFAANVPAAH